MNKFTEEQKDAIINQLFSIFEENKDAAITIKDSNKPLFHLVEGVDNNLVANYYQFFTGRYRLSYYNRLSGILGVSETDVFHKVQELLDESKSFHDIRDLLQCHPSLVISSVKDLMDEVKKKTNVNENVVKAYRDAESKLLEENKDLKNKIKELERELENCKLLDDGTELTDYFELENELDETKREHKKYMTMMTKLVMYWFEEYKNKS